MGGREATPTIMAAAAGGVGALPDSLLVAGSSFNRRRARLINKPTRGETSVNLKGPVLYWMSRDQRVQGIKAFSHLSTFDPELRYKPYRVKKTS